MPKRLEAEKKVNEVKAKALAEKKAAAQAAGAVKDLVADANSKVMAFTTNKLDPLFENNDLKASGTGIYQEVFDSIDYGDETPESAVSALLEGMEGVGYTVG